MSMANETSLIGSHRIANEFATIYVKGYSHEYQITQWALKWLPNANAKYSRPDLLESDR